MNIIARDLRQTLRHAVAIIHGAEADPDYWIEIVRLSRTLMDAGGQKAQAVTVVEEAR